MDFGLMSCRWGDGVMGVTEMERVWCGLVEWSVAGTVSDWCPAGGWRRVMRVLCGPGAVTSLEGSRPAASGTSANENWADLSEGESRP